METVRKCAKCGTEISGFAPEGLCPGCLLGDGFSAKEDPTMLVEPVAQVGPAPAPSPAQESARLFGNYELLEEIARGGMGVVYRARQRSLDRTVAIKMLLFGPQAKPEFIKRFRAEATAAASLQHPNIVAIHEVGVHEDEHYFVMDYVEGQTLAELVSKTPLPAKRAAGYVKLIAEAIHYAHERGILHRDLKPSNVLIDAQNQPRVTDFGLAKRFEGESELTLSGQVVGSPGYLPPEQADAKRGKASRRSDVYGLGAILYHLLTGRPPFQAETLTELLRQVLNTEAVAPRLLNSSVPRDLETICLKCLEKEPARRYTTAQLVAEELGRFLEDKPTLARPLNRAEKAWRWCRREPVRALLLAGLLVVFVLGAIGVLAQWRRAEANRYQTERALVRSEQEQYAAHVALAQTLIEKSQFARARQLLEVESLSRYRGWEWGWLERKCHLDLGTLVHQAGAVTVAFNPKGDLLATGSYDGCVRLWDWEAGKVERTLGGSTGQPWVHTGAGFSADGRRLITFGWDRMARIWEVTTGRQLLVLEHPAGVDCARFSPDGTIMATGAMDGMVRLWNAETGEKLKQADNGDSVLSLAFSTDGKRLAYGGGPRFFDAPPRDTMVKIWDLATDAKQVLPGHAITVMSVAFSPDAQLLATCSFDGMVKLWEVATGRCLPTLETGEGYGAAAALAFSPDGQLLAVAGTRRGMMPRVEIYKLPSGECVRTLEGHSVAVRALAFSPDGSRIATAGFTDQVRIWATTNTPDFLSLEGHNAAVWSVACSGDGRRIATGSFDKTAKVWDATSGLLLQTIPVGMPIVSLALSQNGNRLLTPTPDATATVWDVAAGQPQLKLRGHSLAVMAVALSPDNRWIVTGSKDGTAKLWNSTNGACVRTFVGHSNWVSSVAISTDGRRLLTGSADGAAILWDAGSATRLGRFAANQNWILSVALSPDGLTIAAGSRDKTVRLWDVRTGAVLWQVTHADGVTGLAFSPDGARLASAAGWSAVGSTFEREFGLALTDVRTGLGLLEFAAHSNCVTSVAFNPDGTRLITGSADNTARIRAALPWKGPMAGTQISPAVTVHPESAPRRQLRPALSAAEPAANSSESRTNTLTVIGEVNLPQKSRLKAKPLLAIPQRDVRAGRQQIDLSPMYNAALDETWQPVTTPGQLDLNLALVPRGLQTFGGIAFDVRGLVQLRRPAMDWLWEWQTYPEQVRITVGQKFSRLHVLHGTACSEKEGIVIASYRLGYVDGSEHVFHVVYGRDVLNWVGPAEASSTGSDTDAAVVAWTAESPPLSPGEAPAHLRLFRRTYTNPHPDLEVRYIEFSSTLSNCGPFLVALTVERFPGSAADRMRGSKGNFSPPLAGPPAQASCLGAPEFREPPFLADLSRNSREPSPK